jgi:hypothetical protein
MSIPKVTISVPDNQLGVRAPATAVLAIVACATAGDIATPQPYARIEDVVTEHTSGPLVEAAAYAIERYGLTVLCVRATTTTDGSHGTITKSISGTSDVVATSGAHPVDEYDVVVVVTTGGTVGTAGIKYKYSLDGGQTYSPILALGTAATLAISGTGVSFDLDATDTLIAGDSWSCPTVAPIFDNTGLAAALDALAATQSPWTMLEVCGIMSTTFVTTIQAKLDTMATAGRPRRAFAHVRKPNAGESEAAYLSSLQTTWSAEAAKRVVLCAGYARIDSSIGARPRYRRPPSFAVAPLAASVSEEADLAELAYPLPGVSLRDGNGNPVTSLHDEVANPGLDDARFLTLRSWEGRQSVYVTNPRLFAADGSDFLYLQYGRVVDTACVIAREELEPLLSKGVTVKPDGSGRISTEDAVAIEGPVNARLSSVLVGPRKATSALFSLSRTDDVLRTGTISWKVRVVPLAYIKLLSGAVALVASANAAATVNG